MFTLVIVMMSLFVRSFAWHNMDNSRFHCWPSNASVRSTDTLAQHGFNCKGDCSSYLFIRN